MGQATDEVKAAVDQARSSLPDGIDEPVISRGVYRDRVTDVVIYGPVDIDQLARFAEDLQTLLFREGVTRVRLQGLANPIIRVNVGEAMLIQHDLTIGGVADIIAAEMETTPAGDVSGGSARLRTGQNRRSEHELGEIVIKAPAQGEKLHLRNVAEVETEGGESGRAYFHKGMPAVVLRVGVVGFLGLLLGQPLLVLLVLLLLLRVGRALWWGRGCGWALGRVRGGG